MKTKGFTLIELLAVIVLLAAIAIIALPTVTKSIEDSKETAYQTQIETIKKAANDYILQNMVKGVKFSKFLKNSDDTIDIFLYDLKREGLVDKDIKNPKTGVKLSDKMIINITKNTKGNYDIKVGSYITVGANTKIFEEGLVDDIDNSNTEVDASAPVITLTGSAVRYYEVDASNSTSIDVSGFVQISTGSLEIKKFINGTELTSDITTASVGTYNIEYEATGSNGKSRKATVIVMVKDTTKPTINVPATTQVSSANASSYNLLTYVTFTDNSGSVTCSKSDTNYTCDNGFNIKISGSLTPPIPGKYNITYELTDPSGNTRIKTRKIIITEDN